jgi:hypothetical protein
MTLETVLWTEEDRAAAMDRLKPLLDELARGCRFKNNGAFDIAHYDVKPLGLFGGVKNARYVAETDYIELDPLYLLSSAPEDVKNTIKHEEAHRQLSHLKIKNKPIHQHGELWVYILRLMDGEPPDMYISSIACGEHYSRYRSLASAMRLAENSSAETKYTTDCVASSIFFLNKSTAKNLKLYGKVINEIERRHLEKKHGSNLVTLEEGGEIRLLREGRLYKVQVNADFDKGTLDIEYVPLTTKPHA